MHSSGIITYGSVGQVASVYAPFYYYFPKQYLGKLIGYGPYPKWICYSS